MRYDIEIFPLGLEPDADGAARVVEGNGDAAWRWMAVLHWLTPEHRPDFPGFACRRAMDPVKLARWAYAKLARESKR